MSTIEETAREYASNDAGFTFMLETILKLNRGLNQHRVMVADRDKKIDELTEDLGTTLKVVEELRNELIEARRSVRSSDESEVPADSPGSDLRDLELPGGTSDSDRVPDSSDSSDRRIRSSRRGN